MYGFVRRLKSNHNLGKATAKSKSNSNANFARESVKDKPEPQGKYSQSVFLPKTSFPQRIKPSERPERDANVSKKCCFADLYSWQRRHVSGPEFILHDGPPYANGKLHMGHAINKVLKDITVRHKILQGYKVHYVPGWDCHGLPIELKAVSGSETLSSSTIRVRARNFAKDAINVQMSAFKSWGITADWENGCYYTYDPEYVKTQLRSFCSMYEKGYVYRDLKPVYWSPSSRTALAEAELEYDDKFVSTTATVKMKVTELPSALSNVISKLANSEGKSEVFALIWTTTPWTLPSNRAICFSPKLEYVLAKLQGDEGCMYIIGKDVCQEFSDKIGRHLEVLSTFSGEILCGAKYSSPFPNQVGKDVSLPFLPGNHVTGEKGTGLVHTAPAHGPDDFVVALANGLPLDCYVDEEGCFTSDLNHLNLTGLPVLSKDTTMKVMSILGDNLVHTAPFTHSYPCDWRTKQPVILRASQQWFVATDKLKDLALEQLSKVVVVPERGGDLKYSAMAGMLQRRPYWCISRQRAWGVPLPVLYSTQDGHPVTSRVFIEHLCSCIDQHGADFWWTLPLSDLISNDISGKYSISELKKGQDIMDIWFDSGVSWSSVLESHGNAKVADLYMEGVDQFTGWFQSSLMTSCAIQGISPYKKLYVHGFAVDQEGRKMSKSLGNVVDPEEITCGGKDSKSKPAYGVDALRWWVASHSGTNNNMPVSSELITASAETVHKLHLVLRFLLGCLHGYTKCDHAVDSYDNIPHLDKYLLHLLCRFDSQVCEHYEAFQYNRVCSTIVNFVTNEVSALYCHLVKDRLYCLHLDSPARKSCLRTILQILDVISKAIAPILPHLVEEVYLHHPAPGGDAGFFRWAAITETPSVDWHFPDTVKSVEIALKVRHIINQKAASIGEGNSWKLGAQVEASNEAFERLQALQSNGESSDSELAEILQVSRISLKRAEKNNIRHKEEDYFVQVSASDSDGNAKLSVDTALHLPVSIDIFPIEGRFFKCDRCRRFTASEDGELCHRCNNVLKSMS